MKTLFSEQLSERLSELVARQNFSPNSQSVFFKIGVVPARQKSETTGNNDHRKGNRSRSRKQSLQLQCNQALAPSGSFRKWAPEIRVLCKKSACAATQLNHSKNTPTLVGPKTKIKKNIRQPPPPILAKDVPQKYAVK